jgi:hypothetical protein
MQKETLQDAVLLTLTVKETAKSLEAGKGQEMASSLGIPEKC